MRAPLNLMSAARHLVALLAVSLLTSAATAQEPSATLDALITEQMQHNRVQGLAIVVLRDGVPAWGRGYGVASIASAAPVSTNTVFQAASLGKVTAAYAAMILVERGVLDLDQLVVSHRLAVAPGCDPPRLRHLLEHTSGLSNDIDAQQFAAPCVSGEAFAYSGQGYLILADMIEAATGAPAHEVIAETVFAPLGMANTRYGPALAGDAATGHISAFAEAIGWLLRHPAGIAAVAVVLALLAGALVALTYRFGFIMGAAGLVALMLGATAIYGIGVRTAVIGQQHLPPQLIAASLTSNANDLAAFAGELARPTLVTPATRELLIAGAARVNECLSWGLGVGIDDCGEFTTIWHWGSNQGFESLLVLDPSDGDGVVILTNTGGGMSTMLSGGGGYSAARVIARSALGVDGVWKIGGHSATERRR